MRDYFINWHQVDCSKDGSADEVDEDERVDRVHFGVGTHQVVEDDLPAF